MRYLILTLGILLTSFSYSQSLKFKIIGQKDTTVHLVRYYGNNLHYADTAQIKNGIVEFNGKKQKPGFLAVLLPDQKMFEFIYNNEEVYIETSVPNFIKTMKVKKSEENKVFLNYINYLTEKRIVSKGFNDERKSLDKESAKYKLLSNQMDSVSYLVTQYQKDLIKNNPEKLVSKIVKMCMDVEIPEAPLGEDGKPLDSLFRYHYYFEHFFDNIDLKDDRLVNTSFFHNKLETYFGKTMMIQHWDTIIKYGFAFCDQLDPKSKMFEYCVTYITSNFEKSKIMGMDKVFVMMGNRYYCPRNSEGKSPAYWMPENKLEDLCEKVTTNLNLVMGATPPNICLVDTTGSKWIDFYSINAEYTILYFWDPECGHCKKTTPKLQTLYDQKFKDRNIEIFSVGKAIGDEYPKWKKFIADNHLTFTNVALTDPLYNAALKNASQFVPKYTNIESLNYSKTYDIYATPRIFVLDKDKKIIAKQLSISQLEDLLDKLQKVEGTPKIFPPDPEEDEQMH
jgi:thiol-disulfide isomerase/thioredoxin